MKNICDHCKNPFPRNKGKKSRGLKRFCTDLCQRRNRRYNPSDPYDGIIFKCDKARAIESRIMVYDELTFSVLGYLRPICRLRE